jgi:hypothetical protein
MGKAYLSPNPFPNGKGYFNSLLSPLGERRAGVERGPSLGERRVGEERGAFFISGMAPERRGKCLTLLRLGSTTRIKKDYFLNLWGLTLAISPYFVYTMGNSGIKW